MPALDLGSAGRTRRNRLRSWADCNRNRRHPGRLDLPVAVVSERQSNGRIIELRLYYSSWLLTGRYVNCLPLLQPDPELRETVRREGKISEMDMHAFVVADELDEICRRAQPAGEAGRM